MSTGVATYSYAHSVTYVADNILKSLKDIIVLSGLDPAVFVDADGWETKSRGIRTWLASRDLEQVVLEVFDPATDKLIVRWDIDIVYGAETGDGSFWTDTDQLQYAIKKASIPPKKAAYRLVVKNKPNRPDVQGWVKAEFRSTEDMVKQSLGATVEHSGLSAQAGYWRPA